MVSRNCYLSLGIDGRRLLIVRMTRVIANRLAVTTSDESGGRAQCLGRQ